MVLDGVIFPATTLKTTKDIIFTQKELPTFSGASRANKVDISIATLRSKMLDSLKGVTFIQNASGFNKSINQYLPFPSVIRVILSLFFCAAMDIIRQGKLDHV